MKKITFMMICIIFALTFSHAQNLITNGGFEDATSTYTVLESSIPVLRRVYNLEATQTYDSSPVSDIVAVTPGMWVKKATNSVHIKCAVASAAGLNGTTAMNMKINVGSTATGLTDWHNYLLHQKLVAPLMNSEKYTLTFWARLDGTANNQCNGIVAYLYDPVNNAFLADTIQLTGGTTGTMYTARFDVAAFAAKYTNQVSIGYFGIGMTTNYDSNSKTLYSGALFDNITLTLTPSNNLYPVNGNVGIGTPIPTQALSITGRVAIATSGAVSNENYNGALMITRPQTSGQYINMSRQDGSAWSIGTVYNSNTMGIGLAKTSDAAFTAPYLNIDINGKTGIGTTTPKSKLESVSGVNANPATTGINQAGSALRLRGGDNAVLDLGLNSTNTWLQATDQNNLGLKYNISLNPNGGNVGIGTSTPSQPLDVVGATAITTNGINSDEGYFGSLMITKPDNSGQYINLVRDGKYPWSIGTVYNSNTFAIGTGVGLWGNHSDADFTNPFFSISDGGNVGIGTPTPGVKLDVAGAVKTAELTIEKSDPKIGGTLYIKNPAKGNIVGNRWGIYNMTGTEYGNSLQFWAYDSLAWSGGNCLHRVTFADNGNVGIGAAKPNFKLEVNGNVQINSKIGISLNDTLTPSHPSYGLYKSLSNYSMSWVNDSWTGSGPTLWQSAWGGMKFFTNGTPRLSITSSGQVGIGITNITTDALLSVNGTILAKEVKISLDGLADYVFKPNYKLMPLHEVEQYVNVNNHLPEIPSAAEVSKNGMNMGEMQNKLLQKVEELTLYVIEQQKTINKQSAKIEELEKKMK